MFKPSKISLAVMVLMTTGFSQMSVAQSSGLAEVTITGSNLKRADKEGTSPIQTITAKEIEQSGATSVLQLLKAVPSMGVGGYNDTPDQNGFSRGVATASLRALGSTSTLILLNGRRMTPSAYANPNNGQSTLYDLNSIPISAIERIEEKLLNLAQREVASNKLGELVMRELKKLDKVAYVRFASVYRSFEDLAEFRDAIASLEADPQA